jgi:hypothetical protein
MTETQSPFTRLDRLSLASVTGRPGCEVRDGCIILDGNCPIPLERCDTPEKLLGWIEQLGDKPRFQPLLRDFVLNASHYNKFKIGY